MSSNVELDDIIQKAPKVLNLVKWIQKQLIK